MTELNRHAVQLQMNTGEPLTIHVFHKVEVVNGEEYFMEYQVEPIAGLPEPRYPLYDRADVAEYLYDAGVPLREIVYDATEYELGFSDRELSL